MPRKKTIELQYSNVEFINRNGDKAKADFRHLDNKTAFLRDQEDNAREAAADNGKPVRVYRTSSEGERLVARFYGSSKQEDAEEFAEMLNEGYERQGFYKAEVR